jgi:hypothetical protein
MKNKYCYVLEEEIDESRCERTGSPQCKKCTPPQKPATSKKPSASKQARRNAICSRDTKANKTVNHQNTNPQESSQCLSCEGLKAVTSKESPIKRRRRVADAYVELDFFTCYAQLLRWRYFDPKKLTPELIALAEAIQKWMDDAYEAIINAFRDECKKGNTGVAYQVLKALGPHAFYEKWFNDGLKTLLFDAGKTIHLSPPEDFDFREDYEKMYQLEEKLQETTVDEATDYDQALRSQYYRDFSGKRALFNLHHCYGLLHHSPLVYMDAVEDLPVLDTDTFCELLDQVKRSLPPKYFLVQKPA